MTRLDPIRALSTNDASLLDYTILSHHLKMGVPKFYNVWLKNKGYVGVIQRRIPSDASSLSIDMNGIFHGAAQQVYAYGDYHNDVRAALVKRTPPVQLESELFIAIGTKLLELIQGVNPRDTLVLAVDGVAPQAKISQQRSRRFRAVQGRTAQAPPFDANAITPGTEFMLKLDIYLQRWIDTNKLGLPPKIIYSSHMVPGEGEHKIMQLFREGEISGKGSHVVHGMDADLIFLTLILPVDHVFLWREDIRDILVIDNLRLALQDELKLATAVRDFVLMMFHLGNDFLPHHPALDDFAVSIETLVAIYKMIGQPLTDPAGEIIWSNYLTFLLSLGNTEIQLMEHESDRAFTYPSRAIQYAVAVTETLGEVRRGQVRPTQHRTKIFDFMRFRSAWYSNALGPRGNTDIAKALLGREPFPVTLEGITSLASQYLTGIAWTLAYYQGGIAGINVRWFYPHFHAPLFTDVGPILDQLIRGGGITEWKPQEGQVPLNAVHQLLSVLPLASRSLLPAEVLHLATKDSPIADYFPVDFIYELDGKMVDWQGVAILPFVDPARIINAVNSTTIFQPQRAALFTNTSIIIITRDQITQGLLQARRDIQSFGRGERGRGERGRGERGRGGFAAAPRGRGLGLLPPIGAATQGTTIQPRHSDRHEVGRTGPRPSATRARGSQRGRGQTTTRTLSHEQRLEKWQSQDDVF